MGCASSARCAARDGRRLPPSGRRTRPPALLYLPGTHGLLHLCYISGVKGPREGPGFRKNSKKARPLTWRTPKDFKPLAFGSASAGEIAGQ